MDPPPVQYVTTSDSMNIAYTVSGSGPALVLMPAPVNHLYLRWQRDPLLTSLAAHFTLVHYDSRGQGMSSRGLNEGHGFEDYVLDLEAVVDRSAFERVILLGDAAFADVAVAYAIANPRRVEALILQQRPLGGEPPVFSPVGGDCGQ